MTSGSAGLADACSGAALLLSGTAAGVEPVWALRVVLLVSAGVAELPSVAASASTGLLVSLVTGVSETVSLAPGDPVVGSAEGAAPALPEVVIGSSWFRDSPVTGMSETVSLIPGDTVVRSAVGAALAASDALTGSSLFRDSLSTVTGAGGTVALVVGESVVVSTVGAALGASDATLDTCWLRDS